MNASKSSDERMSFSAFKTKPTLKQMAKSKTNKFNMVIAPAIATILTFAGIPIPLPIVLAVYGIVNFILRRITNTPLNEK